MTISGDEITRRLELGATTQAPVEVFAIADMLAEWRVSYGVRAYEKDNVPAVYFISLYPAFCCVSKYTNHYTSLDELIAALNELLKIVDAAGSDRADAIACLFAISRNKESFELFQEQRELLTLGLKHIYLDNFYQTKIQKLCVTYYETGMLFGVKPNLSLIFKGGKNGCN